MLVKIVNDKPMLETAFSIRKKVFVDEQNVPPHLEIDEYENICSHFLVFSEINIAIAASRMRVYRNQIKFERICVLKEYRGLKVGEKLIRFMEKKALEAGYQEIILEAQTQALYFYKKLGYKTYSEPFLNCNIEHYKMIKELDQKT